ncbi:hypothetical protein MK079_05340, partial [Candidatus Gracilibacteria bacterium]|nr:hypothetical protein [Candidatus Gracilibacteria bacterium]
MKNKTIYLKDYTLPEYFVESIHLDFDIYDGYTNVVSVAKYAKDPESNSDNILTLFGRELELEKILLDGEVFKGYEISGEEMICK